MATGKRARVLRMLFCDFCGKSHEAVKVLIEGRDEVHVCDECVPVLAAMLMKHLEQQQPSLIDTPAASLSDTQEP